MATTTLGGRRAPPLTIRALTSCTLSTSRAPVVAVQRCSAISSAPHPDSPTLANCAMCGSAASLRTGCAHAPTVFKTALSGPVCEKAWLAAAITSSPTRLRPRFELQRECATSETDPPHGSLKHSKRSMRSTDPSQQRATLTSSSTHRNCHRTRDCSITIHGSGCQLCTSCATHAASFRHGPGSRRLPIRRVGKCNGCRPSKRRCSGRCGTC